MRKLSGNPFLFFLPFLLIYVVVVLLEHKNILQGDEGRYMAYANNLIHGFYSPPGEVYLWNGPGYPLMLMPFVALNLPTILITMCNALFHYLSVVFLYKTLVLYCSKKKALVFSLFWACYYIAFKEMGIIYTESFTILLITLFQYFTVKAFKQNASWKPVILSGLVLGYIILTKVIFSYVVIAVLLFALVIFLFIRKKFLQKTIFILSIAMMANLPYLWYTHSLTGKWLYWANSGGSSLYWASSPFEGEFGDWNNDTFTTYCDIDTLIPCNSAMIAKNHEADFQVFRKYTGVELDQKFKEKAIENIKAHPGKYIKNYITNLGRMFFGVPQSFFYQRFQNLLRIPPNAIVFTMMLFSLALSLFRFRQIKFEIGFLTVIMFIYLAGSAALSADQRQFYVIIPIILLWSAFVAEQFIVINLKRKNQDLN